MNLEENFRRMVFAQVLIGIVAACLAEGSPGLVLLAGGIGALSWYVTEGPNGKTLPRLWVNLGAVLAVFWLLIELLDQEVPLLVAMSHFTMILQLLMLYARKALREYAQVLVLSLVQMIGASVLSVSMLYGFFLAVYCLVTLATLLAYHMMISAESVRHENQLAAPEDELVGLPETISGVTANCRMHLRLLGFAIAVACSVVALGVFITTPRSGETGLNFAGLTESKQKQAGFNNTVQLNGGRFSSESREPVLNLTIKSGDVNIGSESLPWLVRGAALDRYDEEARTWQRSRFASASDYVVDFKGGVAPLVDVEVESSLTETGIITLRDPRQRTLFTVVPSPLRHSSNGPAIINLQADGVDSVIFSQVDQQLLAASTQVGATTYQMMWSMRNGIGAPLGLDHTTVESTFKYFDSGSDFGASPFDSMDDRRNHGARFQRMVDRYSRTWRPSSDRVRRYAMRILSDAGLERDPTARHDPNDDKIAAALASHLRQAFTYSLDNPRVPDDQDPVVTFLFEQRSGHCELFAAGLVALCRSVGIPARIVTGYRAGEFNTLGGYYVVRESNAHAWTEVDCGPELGWRTFDATPTAPVRAEHRPDRGLLANIRSLYEHIEFAWIRSVVAFDKRRQEKIIAKLRSIVGSARARVEMAGVAVRDKVFHLPVWFKDDRLGFSAALLVMFGIALGTALLARIYSVRKRRLRRLQLRHLPARERRHLRRRLGFYLTMIDMLERHGHRRPSWQTPHEFAAELSEQADLAPTVPLTQAFYQVRFGRDDIDSDDRDRIKKLMKSLESAFAKPKKS